MKCDIRIFSSGGRYADEDEEQRRKDIFEETHQDRLAYDAEQRELRESLKNAAWGTEDDMGNKDDDGGGELLVRKEPKSKEEQVQEEEEYVKWLKGACGADLKDSFRGRRKERIECRTFLNHLSQ